MEEKGSPERLSEVPSVVFVFVVPLELSVYVKPLDFRLKKKKNL